MSELKNQLGVGIYVPTPNGYKKVVKHYNQHWWQKLLYHIFNIDVLKVKLEK